jgi:hypothetical protein
MPKRRQVQIRRIRESRERDDDSHSARPLPKRIPKHLAAHDQAKRRALREEDTRPWRMPPESHEEDTYPWRIDARIPVVKPRSPDHPPPSWERRNMFLNDFDVAYYAEYYCEVEPSDDDVPPPPPELTGIWGRPPNPPSSDSSDESSDDGTSWWI